MGEADRWPRGMRPWRWVRRGPWGMQPGRGHVSRQMGVGASMRGGDANEHVELSFVSFAICLAAGEQSPTPSPTKPAQDVDAAVLAMKRSDGGASVKEREVEGGERDMHLIGDLSSGDPDLDLDDDFMGRVSSAYSLSTLPILLTSSLTFLLNSCAASLKVGCLKSTEWERGEGREESARGGQAWCRGGHLSLQHKILSQKNGGGTDKRIWHCFARDPWASQDRRADPLCARVGSRTGRSAPCDAASGHPWQQDGMAHAGAYTSSLSIRR